MRPARETGRLREHHRFEGQVSVFWAERGPCYRCLYRDPPPPELVPSCEEGGVLGVLPGIVGALQAAEALKLVLGAGTPLVGRLLLVDALTMRFREMQLEKDHDCPLCGPRRTLDHLIDYDAFCGVTPQGAVEGTRMELTVFELRDLRATNSTVVLVDVREQWEFDLGHLEGSVHVPLGTLPDRLAELDREVEVVTICHTGRRSLQAAHFLHAAGFRKVRSLKGGVEAWAVNIDPAMPRY